MTEVSMREVLERIEAKVDRACVSAERAADMSMATHDKLNRLEQVTEGHGDRIRKLELRDSWMPVILSSVATLVAVATLVTVVLRGIP